MPPIESIASVYSAISGKYAAAFRDTSDNLEAFLRLIEPGGFVLDVGCGPGIDARYIVSRGYSVRAIDVSQKMVALARRNAPAAVVERRDVRKLRLRPESIDGILTSFSLIHLQKSEVPFVLDSFRKWLKPHGALYVGFQGGTPEEKTVREPLDPRRTVFLNIMSEGEMQSMLERTGFEILESFTRPSQSGQEFSYDKRTVIARKR
jgi:ubiquinone/menaquinone biosynthesis C-methylase UbiE